MRALFVDTSGWVAVADQSDQFHERAARFYGQAFAHYARLVTTSLILAESYALLRRALPTDRVLYWLDRLLASPRVEVVYDDRALIDRARSVLAAYGDQKFSLVDGVSFAVMRDRRIREALAFDRHFQTAGFTLVPRDQ
jgi:predicted nucleic acid-binding protein